MKIAIGCDEAATALKDIIKATMIAWGHDVTDYGTFEGHPVLYPDIAVTVANAIMAGQHERGVLLCGTGIGVAISANKVSGIRAAQTHDTYSAERAMKSNNAQIITLGSRVIGPELAKCVVHAYLSSEFSGGASAEKVDRIAYYEGLVSA